MVTTASPPTGQVPRSTTVERMSMGLGRAFVDAIVAGDFDRLETLLAADVRFRALIPDEYQEAATAAGARSHIEDWYGGTDLRQVLESTVDIIGDRLALGYRLELSEAGERRVVEQHVAASIDGGQFRDIALVCSGFRPLAADPAGTRGMLSEDDSVGDDDHPGSARFTPAARLDATGLSCATLTPTISATVRGLDFGAVLEIVTDDPEAEEGLRSWTRLTGNELVAAEAGPGSARRFGIRRGPRRAATTMKGTN